MATPNGNRRPRQDKKKPLFHPRIYEFQCQGSLHLSSNNQDHEGACRGLKSRLKMIEDWPASTKEKAIKDFQFATNFEDQSTLIESASDDSNANTPLSMESFIYNQTIIYNDDDDNKDKTESPTTFLPSWHKWSSYGSASVRLLALREEDSKQEKIVGVAPDCLMGLSFRDAGIEVNGKKMSAMTVTSLHALDSGLSTVDIFEAPDVANGDCFKAAQVANAPSDKSTSPIASKQNKEETGSADSESDRKSGRWEFPRRTFHFMKKTAVVFRDAVKDDFPGRTFNAGRKISGEFGKTVTRTANYMQKIVGNYWRVD